MKTRIQSIIERAISYSITFAAFIGFLYFQNFVAKNQKNYIQNKKQEIEKYKKTIEERKQIFAERKKEIEKIEKLIDEKQKEVKKYENLLGKYVDHTKFIEQIHKKAQQLNISIEDVKIAPPQSLPNIPQNYVQFTVHLKVSGLYENMKLFLWHLENSLGRIVKVTNVVINPPICDDEGKMKLNISVTTYFIR